MTFYSNLNRSLAAALACLAVLPLSALPAAAHGVVGDRTFMEPLVAEDANPANEFDVLAPSWQGGNFVEGIDIEKTLTRSISLSLGGEWNGATADAGPGFANPEIALKGSVWRSEAHEGIVAIGLSASPPIGTPGLADTTWGLGPMVAFGKGFGDLPDSVGWVRPFALQGDLDADVPLDATADRDLHLNLALSYSLPYLQQEVTALGLPWPISGVLPQVEVDLTQTVSGPDAGQFTGVALPGFAWIGSYNQVSLAAMVPLNAQSGGYGVMALLDLYLDDIFPTSYGQPLWR
ncbi:MAG TPA: hypothetical protein V6D47_15245 [Oscillatoriaceae cyanobacterium]